VQPAQFKAALISTAAWEKGVCISHFLVKHILHMCSPHINSELRVGRASWFVFATGREIYQIGPEFDFFY